MDNDGLKDHEYHVFWPHDFKEKTKIGKKICQMSDPDAPILNYRKINNGKQLKNTLKKYFGTQENVDAAIKQGSLRIVLGVEVLVTGILTSTEG